MKENELEHVILMLKKNNNIDSVLNRLNEPNKILDEIDVFISKEILDPVLNEETYDFWYSFVVPKSFLKNVNISMKPIAGRHLLWWYWRY